MRAASTCGGEAALSNWSLLSRNLLLGAKRENTIMVREHLGMRDLEKKAPVATARQRQCQHEEMRREGNQWYNAWLCRDCGLRTDYLPTAQAAEKVGEKRIKDRRQLQRTGCARPSQGPSYVQATTKLPLNYMWRH